MTACNTTLEDAPVSDVKLSVGITFHHLGLIISAVFGLVAIAISSYLILQHALHYRVPREQKHIIRILFMIPVYATVSFLSYFYYAHAVYFQVIGNCYEAFAISSFFTLICNYLAPSLHDQKDYFRTLKPKNWIWPFPWFQKCTGGQDKGWLRKPASGLTWFNVIYLGIFQYCLIRIVFTIVSVFTQAIGRYCEASLSPVFGHIWCEVFESLGVTIAMYVLIQFYVQLKKDLAGHNLTLKLLCIKLVIFFSFWQTLLISLLSSTSGPLQPTETIAYPDIQVGIPSMLLCIEMAIFSVMHLFAFPWRKPYGADSAKSPFVPGEEPYRVAPTPYQGGFLGWRAFADAFNPWDIIKALARSIRWLFVGRRTRRTDASYQTGASSEVWGGAGAFDGPEDSKIAVAAAAKDQPTFVPLEYRGALQSSPPRYEGPHQARAGLSRMQSAEDDDAWTHTAGPVEDVYTPPALQREHSFEGREEDRAGLLRQAVAPGRTGVSPGRSEVHDDDLDDRVSESSHSHHGFDKEVEINEQYTGYGRYSWGRGPPGSAV